jgi:hypothetical protein
MNQLVSAKRQKASHLETELPDGIFSYKKQQFYKALEWKMLVHLMVI